MEIYDVDFVQTANMAEGTGSLIIEMALDNGEDVTRTHRNVPESVYEAWEAQDFSATMYVAAIAGTYPFSEESDDEDDED